MSGGNPASLELGTLRRSTAGMTLVELLVGLSLLSLIALLLTGGLRLGLRVWEAGEGRAVIGDRLGASDAFLHELLAQAQIRFDDLQLNSPRGFAGSADRIAFMAPLPAQFGHGARSSFLLAQQQEGSAASLVLQWQGGAGSSGDFNGTTVLLAGFQAARFSYFGRLSGEAAAGWHDAWSGHSGLPALIRLDLTGLPAPAPATLALYFAPRLAGGG